MTRKRNLTREVKRVINAYRRKDRIKDAVKNLQGHLEKLKEEPIMARCVSSPYTTAYETGIITGESPRINLSSLFDKMYVENNVLSIPVSAGHYSNYDDYLPLEGDHLNFFWEDISHNISISPKIPCDSTIDVRIGKDEIEKTMLSDRLSENYSYKQFINTLCGWASTIGCNSVSHELFIYLFKEANVRGQSPSENNFLRGISLDKIKVLGLHERDDITYELEPGITINIGKYIQNRAEQLKEIAKGKTFFS